MYGVVLMMAMNTSTDVPDFGRRGGCCGCYGGGWGGCYGGWGGCYGGCYGGRWGGCYGGWGGCYGGWGGYSMGWGGCYGGWGGCYGGGWGGGFGYGGYVVSTPTVIPTYSVTPGVGTVVVSNTAAEPATTTQSMYYTPANASGERAATVIVHMPKSARLFIDDKPSRNMASVRRFQTPPLPANQDFHYTLRAEMDRDGQPVTTSKTITVRAGKPTEVTLSFPTE